MNNLNSNKKKNSKVYTSKGMNIPAIKSFISFTIVFVLLIGLFLGSCTRMYTKTFKIIAGSENKALEQIIKDYGKKNGINFDISYKGSVDIMLMLESGQISDYDAVWPANSLWIDLGDKNYKVKFSESIMRSPVVLGVKKSIAEKLGWIGKEVNMDEILNASESGAIRVMMTSATQSNSGASAYFGFLYAFAGNPDILTLDNLNNAAVQNKVKRFLGSIDRSSESSGWLKELFLNNYSSFDAMFNYESLIIEADQQLIMEGREPLYAVYPIDGLAIADHPIGFIDNGDKEKEKIFLGLQEYLLSQEVQDKILSLGRRVGIIGINPEAIDKKVFNEEWGIDVKKVLSPIKFPDAKVIRQALDLYQTTLRKSSFTVYCLDFSPSMKNNGGREQLITAMKTLMDQEIAKQYLLQAAGDDINIVLVFSENIMNINNIGEWTVEGNDPVSLDKLYGQIVDQSIGSQTNIYQPIIEAFEIIRLRGIGNTFPAVILMTDGLSNTGGDFNDLKNYIQKTGFSVPVFAVTFGDASEDQLKPIVELTSGQIFDGRKDLVSAFRKAKGNN